MLVVLEKFSDRVDKIAPAVFFSPSFFSFIAETGEETVNLIFKFQTAYTRKLTKNFIMPCSIGKEYLLQFIKTKNFICLPFIIKGYYIFILNIIIFILNIIIFNIISG